MISIMARGETATVPTGSTYTVLPHKRSAFTSRPTRLDMKGTTKMNTTSISTKSEMRALPVKLGRRSSTNSQSDEQMDSESNSTSTSPSAPAVQNSEVHAMAHGEPKEESPTNTLPDSTVQITKSWDVPPRPKPGRKPALDVPPTKRKAQNRDSQRKFRQKKVEEVVELRAQLRAQEAEIQQKETQWAAERQKHHEEIQQMLQWQRHAEYWQQIANANQAAVVELEAKVRELKTRSSTHHHDDMRHGSTTSLLPSLSRSTSTWDNAPSMTSTTRQSDTILSTKSTAVNKPFVGDEMEIDFTTYSKTPSQPSRHSYDEKPADDLIPSMVINTPMDGKCGFCAEGGICLCDEVDQQASAQQAMATEIASDAISTAQTVQIMEPPAMASGPGTCSACLSDPERRRYCQSLANQMQLPPLTQNSASDNYTSMQRDPASDTNNLRERSVALRVTCAETFDRLEQYPHFKENSSRIIRELRPEPADEPMTASLHAPLAVDAESLDAACMLAAMSSAEPRARMAEPK